MVPGDDMDHQIRRRGLGDHTESVSKWILLLEVLSTSETASLVTPPRLCFQETRRADTFICRVSEPFYSDLMGFTSDVPVYGLDTPFYT